MFIPTTLISQLSREYILVTRPHSHSHFFFNELQVWQFHQECPGRKYLLQNLNSLPVNQPKSLLEIYHSQPGLVRHSSVTLQPSLSVTKKLTPSGSLLPLFCISSKFYLLLSVTPRLPSFMVSQYWWQCDSLTSLPISILKLVLFLY